MFDTGGMNVTTQGSSQNGFIASLGDAWDKSVDKVTQEVLPNWVEKTLNDQLGVSHLDSPTYNQSAAPPRQGGLTTGDKPDESMVKPAGFSLVEKFSINSGAVLAIGVVLLGAVVAVKLYKSV